MVDLMAFLSAIKCEPKEKANQSERYDRNENGFDYFREQVLVGKKSSLAVIEVSVLQVIRQGWPVNSVLLETYRRQSTVQTIY